MGLKVNQAGVKYAEMLIMEGRVDKKSEWSNTRPTTEEGDVVIEEKGWEKYGKWFLAINDEIPEEEKKHYEFPYGDFKKVYREGLIAAKHRAAQYKHLEIEKAADQLIRMINKR